MRRAKIIFVLLVSLVFFLPVASLAVNLLPAGTVIKDGFASGIGAPIGKILIVQGEAVLIHTGEKKGYRADKDVSLYKGDTVVTRDRSRLRYQLNDESVVTMAAETRVVLSQSEYSEDSGRAAFLKLDGGKARFLVKKLLKAKRSEFKIKTPTALVGVRGSDFIINASLLLTEVTTLKHTLLEVLSGAALDKPPVMLSDLQKTSIEKGALPSDVVNISEEEMEALHEEFAMGREMRGGQPRDIRDRGRQAPKDQQDQGDDDSGESDEGGGEAQAADTGEAADAGTTAAPQEATTATATDPQPTQEDSGLKLEPQVNILVPVDVLEEPEPMTIDPVIDTTTITPDQEVFKQLDVTVPVEDVVTDTIQQQPITTTPTVLPGLPDHP